MINRIRDLGLELISVQKDDLMMPHLAVSDHPEGEVEESSRRVLLARLSPEEVVEWQAGKAKASGEKIFFTWPHHCAVGTKPPSPRHLNM